MKKQTKSIMTILGILATFTITRLALPTQTFEGIYLSPPSVFSITLMDTIWALLALTVSIAYWHWLWKK